MKRIVVTESEAVFIPEIIDVWDISESEKECGKIRDIWNTDPDYFNYDDLLKVPFVETCDKYIIVPDYYEISEEAKEMLISFFEDNFKTVFDSLVSSWDVFMGTERGIAYRGGSGYVYSIWMYKK